LRAKAGRVRYTYITRKLDGCFGDDENAFTQQRGSIERKDERTKHVEEIEDGCCWVVCCESVTAWNEDGAGAHRSIFLITIYGVVFLRHEQVVCGFFGR
jgi:hypothetical protein